MLEEHNYTILTPFHVSKLRYSVNFSKNLQFNSVLSPNHSNICSNINSCTGAEIKSLRLKIQRSSTLRRITQAEKY